MIPDSVMRTPLKICFLLDLKHACTTLPLVVHHVSEVFIFTDTDNLPRVKISSIVLCCTFIWTKNCAFAARNKPSNFITQTAQGQGASLIVTTSQNFLLWSLHSSKSNRSQNENYSDSKAGWPKRVSYTNRSGGSPNYGPRGPSPARKGISSGPRRYFVNNEKIIFIRKIRWFGRM